MGPSKTGNGYVGEMLGVSVGIVYTAEVSNIFAGKYIENTGEI